VERIVALKPNVEDRRKTAARNSRCEWSGSERHKRRAGEQRTLHGPAAQHLKQAGQGGPENQPRALRYLCDKESIQQRLSSKFNDNLR